MTIHAAVARARAACDSGAAAPSFLPEHLPMTKQIEQIELDDERVAQEIMDVIRGLDAGQDMPRPITIRRDVSDPMPSVCPPPSVTVNVAAPSVTVEAPAPTPWVVRITGRSKEGYIEEVVISPAVFAS